jgi:NAD(P)-dependent dehydrogenase (short-subunit alcohol dehydrogenase family)
MNDGQSSSGDGARRAFYAPNATALVVGASGGIGGAILSRLLANEGFAHVHAWSRSDIQKSHERLTHTRVDVSDENHIAEAAAGLDRVDFAIVATGLLQERSGRQPEKSLRDLSTDQFAANFAVNTIAPALILKHLHQRIPRDTRAVFAAISARVGSITDNRLGGWYSYRASKAALNQIVKTASIEIARTRPHCVCVTLHPGTVDTSLSEPFQKNVAPDKLFTQDYAAEKLLEVTDGLTVKDSGRLFAWDGTEIPF